MFDLSLHPDPAPVPSTVVGKSPPSRPPPEPHHQAPAELDGGAEKKVDPVPPTPAVVELLSKDEVHAPKQGDLHDFR